MAQAAAKANMDDAFGLGRVMGRRVLSLAGNAGRPHDAVLHQQAGKCRSTNAASSEGEEISTISGHTKTHSCSAVLGKTVRGHASQPVASWRQFQPRSQTDRRPAP